MKRIRRINLYSGAGGGKTITATNVCSQLGFKGYKVELINETIKEWTYIPRVPTSCDGFYLNARQIQKEDIRLRAGVDLIVSDSPVFLQYFYALFHKVPLTTVMLRSSFEFDMLYPSLNIFINREDKFYDEVGRYETLKEAKCIDIRIKNLMNDNSIEYKEFSCLDQKEMVDYIISQLEKNNAQNTTNRS